FPRALLSPSDRAAIDWATAPILIEPTPSVAFFVVPEPLLAPENDYRSLLDREVPAPSLSVAVVIPVYNRVRLLERTLAGVRAQRYPSSLISVVVADDGSEEDVREATGALGPDITIEVVRRERSGYGAGQARSLGAARAEGAEVLVFLDADCIPDPDAVLRHAVWHHLASNLVVIGSRHHTDTSELSAETITNDPLMLRRLVFDSSEPQADDWVSEDYRGVLHRRTASLRHGDMAFRSLVSSNFSIRRETFLDVGGFSEDFRRWGGEDTELGWRLWNAGAFFVDEPRAAIYHQLQEDAGDEGWREESRQANDGLIQSKIPHRHYRQAADTIHETPKVSVVIHHPDEGRLEELAAELLGQILHDVEIIMVDEPDTLQRFTERRSADPRFGRSASVEEAIESSRGEFVAMLHGATAIDHRLLSRSVAALERRPGTGWVRSAYAIPTTEGLEIYRRREDTERLDQAWSDRLPVFGLTRRRDLRKALAAGRDAPDAWSWVTQHLDEVSHATPLVILPSADPRLPRPETLVVPKSVRSMVVSDLKAGGKRAVTAPWRAARAVLTGGSYLPTPVEPTESRPPAAGSPARIRYVGWTGRDNLGDEAMLLATRQLFPDAEVGTEGEAGDLLMLGGGTLINRGYLRLLRPLDSPYLERVVFGSGVAHPEYWGETREDPADWVAFLETCLYVGVRGPRSAALLSDWGLKRDPEVMGDPALSLRPHGSVANVEGRVVVCPAWAKGLLWGGSDETVISAFADLARSLRADGHEVWALSAFPGDDRHIIAMMREAEWPDMPYLAAHDDPPAAMDLLASADLVVSERLHGAVLAAAAGTVPLMVEYRPKLRDFAGSVGLEDLVVRTDQLARGALAEMFRRVFGERKRHHDVMTARVDELRQRQAEAAHRISESLQDG
ncbi:MAG: glycosyltransferase, partial [Acidimicrobiia bacterium]